MLEDNSPMPFGKYKGIQMVDVPASYLIWLYENDKCNDEVRLYIEDCKDALYEEIENG
jgi:uncharacterized protein (DUF3820 family)